MLQIKNKINKSLISEILKFNFMFSGANLINIPLDTINDIEPFHFPTAVKIYKQRTLISNPQLLWNVFFIDLSVRSSVFEYS